MCGQAKKDRFSKECCICRLCAIPIHLNVWEWLSGAFNLYSAVAKFATSLCSVAALLAASLDYVSGAVDARSRCEGVAIYSKYLETKQMRKNRQPVSGLKCWKHFCTQRVRHVKTTTCFPLICYVVSSILIARHRIILRDLCVLLFDFLPAIHRSV